MQINCFNYKQWAEISGYKLHPLKVKSGKEPLSSKYDFIENIKIAKKTLIEQEKSCPVLIECHNVKVLVWNWEENPNTHKYRYFYFSEKNDLLIDDPIDSEVWLPYYPIFSFQNGQTHIKDEVLSPKEGVNFKSPTIFAAGHSQFAHWFSDHLSNFFVGPAANIDCNQFVVSKHTDYQNQTLESLNFFKSNPHIHSINVGNNLYRMIQFNKLYILANYGIRDRFNLIREVINNNFSIPDQTKRMCYLPRGILRNQKRIVNESEVFDICKKYNIEIADGTNYSFKDCATIYPQFSTFISGPSAANVNFHLFSSDKSKFLYGQSSSYQIPNSTVVVGSACYLLPKLNDTEIMLLDMASPVNNRYDDPVFFNIPLLEAFLQKRL